MYMWSVWPTDPDMKFQLFTWGNSLLFILPRISIMRKGSLREAHKNHEVSHNHDHNGTSLIRCNRTKYLWTVTHTRKAFREKQPEPRKHDVSLIGNTE